MRFFLTLALLTSMEAGKAQVYFSEQIDWAHFYDFFSVIALTQDQTGFFLAGGSEDFLATQHFSLFTRLSPTGQILWKKTFLPKPNAFGDTYDILPLNQPFALLVGNYWLPTLTGDFDFQVVVAKINLGIGDTLWVKEYGKPQYFDQVWTIVGTGDAGAIMCGTTFPDNNNQHANMLLIKIDSLGNQVFRKEYSTDMGKDHFAFSLAETTGGGFIILGQSSYEGPYLGGGTENKIDMVIIQTDNQGNQLNVHVYTPWEWKQILFYGRDICSLSDGNFLLAGLKNYAVYEIGNTYASKYFIAKVNPSGEFVDSLTLPELHSSAIINRLKPAFDGTFWAVGAEKDSQSLGRTGLIMRITPDLQVLWKREYRVSPPESLLHEMFYDAVEMPDHGFVLAGRAFGPLEDSTWQNGWVIRVDSLGCLEPGCDTVFTAVHDPPAGEQAAGLSLYPNPTDGAVQLALPDPDNRLLGVRLLDAQGRVLHDVQFRREAGWRACSFDLAGQAAGVYVVQVRTTKGWVVRQVIKQ